jgi:hypothetical protein
MIAARQIAFGKAAGKGLSAKDYIQDGLIAMWDGIENAGWGVHSNTDLVDLLGSAMTFTGTCGDNYFIGPAYEKQRVSGNALTCELCSLIPDQPDYVALMGPNNMGIMSYRNIVTTENSNTNYAIPGSYLVGAHLTTILIDSHRRVLVDAVEHTYIAYGSGPWTPYSSVSLGGRLRSANNFDHICSGFRLYNLRYYSRVLTAEEIAHNYSIDKARFGL